MKFEFKKNKNGTVDIMYKSNDITINLHGNTQEVEEAYNRVVISYLGYKTPFYSELNKYDNYGYELPDAVEESEVVEEPEESDEEHVKTYREDFKEKYPYTNIDCSLCVNTIYYNCDDCRCPDISCTECWNRDLGT